MRLVPASMSCTAFLYRRSQLVTRPGLSPVHPAPAVSAHLWCQHLLLQRQSQILDVPGKVSSALSGVGRVNLHVCGGYNTGGETVILCTVICTSCYILGFGCMHIERAYCVPYSDCPAPVGAAVLKTLVKFAAVLFSGSLFCVCFVCVCVCGCVWVCACVRALLCEG